MRIDLEKVRFEEEVMQYDENQNSRKDVIDEQWNAEERKEKEKGLQIKQSQRSNQLAIERNMMITQKYETYSQFEIHSFFARDAPRDILDQLHGVATYRDSSNEKSSITCKGFGEKA
ncbi:MAG: hypothetical protein EZS28_011826 [Streblomastix strix]|uniref:Uncharacterized protein n=1 Tax=Streblomastix strix TaxID=222440 RepID=A0A5J4WCH9_9EUKA|nr:MAG: hypothetical protein EZS28_011826 [Streblomastix strix]